MTRKKKKKLTALLNRRDLLRIAGVGGAAALIGRYLSSGPLSPFGALHAKQERGHSSHTPVNGPHWAMVIDLDKCIGCHYCVYGCQATNDWLDGMDWNIVVEEQTRGGHPFFFSRPCLHCVHPPCAEVCPVGATYREDDSTVVMDYDRCIGCRYCMVACPYGARRFNWKSATAENPRVPLWGTPEIPRRARGVVEKCTFCKHRLDHGLERGLTPGVDSEATPACVNICPVGARIFGDLHDPESPVARILEKRTHFRLREDLGAEPSVYYLPVRDGEESEESTA
jgi:Fe-S-cluster-containing dehydrogenase component